MINKRTIANILHAEVAGFEWEGIYAAGGMGTSEEMSLQAVVSSCCGEGTKVNQAQKPSSSSSHTSHQ